MSSTEYDVIVIGSGAGGLTTAVPLAQAGKRILVLEQHYVPGGWTHSFTLNGYRFSPGVHYIGGLAADGAMRRIYEGLGVSKDLAFCELNPDGYDHVFIGEEQFDIPKGRELFSDRLKSRFPEEARGIDGYVNLLRQIPEQLAVPSRVRGIGDALMLPYRARHLLRWVGCSGGSMINRFVKNPVLRGILAAQSGDHGMPPSMVSAPLHAAVTAHYFDGAYYPVGGAFSIPRAFLRALKDAGGEIRLSTRVDRILMGKQGVTGVRLTDGTEITAAVVVSNADPAVTFDLVGREHLSAKLKKRLDHVRYSTSAVSLFMAVDMDLKAAGLDSGNYWFYKDHDVDRAYRNGMSDHVVQTGNPDGLFLTVTTLKDPSKMYRGHHTVEAFSFVGYEPFERWANAVSGDRDVEYDRLKERLMEGMLAEIESRVPGLRDRIVFKELGTPLSNEHYLNATRGNLYGISKERFQVGPWAFQNNTEIDGLWMSGASTSAGHGVAGATYSGMLTAKQILGCRGSELLKQEGQLPIYPSDDPDAWPEELRVKIERQRAKATAE